MLNPIAWPEVWKAEGLHIHNSSRRSITVISNFLHITKNVDLLAAFQSIVFGVLLSLASVSFGACQVIVARLSTEPRPSIRHFA